VRIHNRQNNANYCNNLYFVGKILLILNKGGMTLIQAFVRNVGTRPVIVRENPISEDHEVGKYRGTERGADHPVVVMKVVEPHNKRASIF
jgi:hypothetical protein